MHGVSCVKFVKEDFMSLSHSAKKVLDILEAGYYTAPSGAIRKIAAEQQAAVAGTVLYTPQEAQALLKAPKDCPNAAMRIEVTDESTQAAARRLVQDEACADLVLLNFASAKNPGGGFLGGAKAQEEDLARSSGLYPCLLEQPAYYNANRAFDSLLYTDHMIYSPRVPWFRAGGKALLEQPFPASVITAPAPNAGEVLRRDPKAGPDIERSLRRRAGLVLAVARDRGHRNLLLGAWGCGVFRNDPVQVAGIFDETLREAHFEGCFERVVFAVYDKSRDQATLQAFQERFGAG